MIIETKTNFSTILEVVGIDPHPSRIVVVGLGEDITRVGCCLFNSSMTIEENIYAFMPKFVESITTSKLVVMEDFLMKTPSTEVAVNSGRVGGLLRYASLIKKEKYAVVHPNHLNFWCKKGLENGDAVKYYKSVYSRLSDIFVELKSQWEQWNVPRSAKVPFSQLETDICDAIMLAWIGRILLGLSKCEVPYHEELLLKIVARLPFKIGKL